MSAGGQGIRGVRRARGGRREEHWVSSAKALESRCGGLVGVGFSEIDEGGFAGGRRMVSVPVRVFRGGSGKF